MLSGLKRVVLAVLVFVAGSVTPALSQPSGAKGDDFIHKVMAGDTLGDLSGRYTTAQSNWTLLQQLNEVGKDTQLPIAKQLRIPFSLIPEVAASATVVYATGEVMAGGRVLHEGDNITEGDVLATGADGFVTLQLADSSVISVPARSTLEFSRLRAFEKTGLIDTIVTVKDGSVDAIVAPDNTGVGRFEVRSPVSITGVRGTRLRVHLADQGSRSELVSGLADVLASSSSEVNLAAAQGVAVNAQGQALGVRKLLPAPVLSTASRASGQWQTTIEPVPGAASYLLLIAADPDGSKVVSRQAVEAGTVALQAPGAGTWYAFVRAIDDIGLGGLDASVPFDGTAILRSSDGSGVSTAYGLFVGLGY